MYARETTLLASAPSRRDLPALATHYTSGVIWITGRPNVGKTTTGDACRNALVSRGIGNVVRLDGDAIRQTLNLSAVETHEDRIALGIAYVDFATHLARQGMLVIVSAVAMYDEVYAAINSVEDVDCLLVKLCTSSDASAAFVGNQVVRANDPLRTAEHILALAGKVGLVPSETAMDSWNTLDALQGYSRDRQVRVRHWENYYRTHEAPSEPSSFATAFLEIPEVQQLLSTESPRLLDFGCGNGRDSKFLGGHFTVLGIDSADAAVTSARSLCQADSANPIFQQVQLGDFPGMLESFQPHVIYCRFVLHALTAQEQDLFFASIASSCAAGTLLAIEVRSSDDPMASRGSKLSETERVFGHYRRFLDPDELRSAIGTAHLEILRFDFGPGLTPLGDDDPSVIRVLAKTR